MLFNSLFSFCCIYIKLTFSSGTLSNPSSPLVASSLGHVRGEEVHEIISLSNGNTLLAQNGIGGGHVEVQVGNSKASRVGSTGKVNVHRSEGSRLDDIGALVDSILIGGIEDLLNSLDALVHVGVCGQVVLEDGGLTVVEAGDHLFDQLSGDVDLVGQGVHIFGQTGFREGFGIGMLLALAEDIGHGLEGIFEAGDGSVVESEGRHGEMIVRGVDENSIGSDGFFFLLFCASCTTLRRTVSLSTPRRSNECLSSFVDPSSDGEESGPNQTN